MNKIEWGIVVNGELRYAPPEIYEEDGKVKELKYYDDFINEGYKRVIRKKPTYNPLKQCVVFKEFVEKEVDIYILYEVKDIESVSIETLETIMNEEINK